jgi:hypothetical protein
MSTDGTGTPLPVKVMVRGLPATLSQSASVLVWVPRALGVNDAVIVQELPGAQTEPSVQVVLQANAPLVQMAGPVQVSSRSALMT